MATPKINYTSRDFPTILQSFENFLKTKFPNDWKNFYLSGISTGWSELVAYAFSVLSYYEDVIANNSYLPTAMDREAVIAICKLVGYRLHPATAASVVCIARLSSGGVSPENTVIAAGTTVVTDKGVTFSTLTEQMIHQGSVSAEITLHEGAYQTDQFVGQATGFQKLILSRPAAVSSSLQVLVDGDPWTEVSSLVLAGPEDKKFVIEYDADDYGTLIFGDGTTGATLPLNSEVEVTYRVGGGVAGNIAVGEINKTVTGTQAGAGNVQVSLINEEPGSGGEDRETIEHAKFWAPVYAMTNGRAVTEADFDALATAFTSSGGQKAAFAKAKLHQEIPESNLVDLFIWGRDSQGNITVPSSALKTALQDYFDNNGPGAVRLICLDTLVQDGLILYLDVSVEVSVESHYSSTTVLAQVRQAISDLFTTPENVPGTTFRLSKVYNAIHGVAGVNHALVNDITASYKTTSTLAILENEQVSTTIALERDLPLVERSLVIQSIGQSSTMTIVDDGLGHLTGDIDEAGVNTVNYTTGELSFKFSNGYAGDYQISYRRVVGYSRSDLVMAAPALEIGDQLHGRVHYPPILPRYQTSTHGIAFTNTVAGGTTQYVWDKDGDGKLYDSQEVLRGWIEYESGNFEFQFPTLPVEGSSIYAAYTQKLRTPSEDIPVEKNQIAVAGLITAALP